MNNDELSALKREINELKSQKKLKMALATSKSEKAKLQAEINQLDNVGKSDSKLKSFGKTFARGLRVTGKALFRGIKAGSRNLNKNAPEYRDFNRTMMSEPNQSLTQRLYAPRPKSIRMRKEAKKIKRMMRQPMMSEVRSWELP